MTIPPLNLDPILLAAHVAKAFSAAHRLAYAQIGPDLTVLQASPNFAFLLEDQTLAVNGRFLPDLLREFVGAEKLLAAMMTGEQDIYRIKHVNRERADGSISYLTFQMTPLFPEQPGQGLLLLIEDETAYGRLQQSLVQDRNEIRLVQRQLQIANEELNKLNRLKSLFLSMAAHDLRTPLTAIHGYATLLNHKTKDPQQKKYLEIIFDQSDRLNRLISDLIDLDRVEQGQLIIDRQPCRLNKLVKEVSAAFQAHADLRQITFHAILPDTTISLMADGERLWRAVANLVGNAIKYSKAGDQISLGLRQEKSTAIIEVTDTGQGMTEIEINRLFTPYFRTDEARASKVAGTGLGLFIVKTIVEAHDGRIQVTSQHGQGTTFTIHLPITS